MLFLSSIKCLTNKKPHWVKLYIIVLFIEWKESLNECEEYECTADASSHYVDISDLVIPVMMLNDPNLNIDMDSMGWRSRKPKEMVSFDEILGAGS